MQAHAESDSSDDESAIGTELVVNNVPVEVFENRFVQEDFKALFCGYGLHVTFRFLKDKKRVFAQYLALSQCKAAVTELNDFSFEGAKLTVALLSRPSAACLLKPPKKKKELLISPPISPPTNDPLAAGLGSCSVGSLMLQAAIASLGKSGTSFELHPGDEKAGQPKIIVTMG